MDRLTIDNLSIQNTKTKRSKKQDSRGAFQLIHINKASEGDGGETVSIYCQIPHGNLLQINFNCVLTHLGSSI